MEIEKAPRIKKGHPADRPGTLFVLKLRLHLNIEIGFSSAGIDQCSSVDRNGHAL